MYIFFSANIQNGQTIFDEDESRHCQKVLRKRVGDKVHVTDGSGTLYEGLISQVSKKSVIVSHLEIIRKQEKLKSISIAIAPTKNISRFEWFLEKSTEIGITDIYPFIGDHSERKVIKPERLEKIIIASMKQSMNFNKPTLHDLMPFQKLVDLFDSYDHDKFIAHCDDPAQLLINEIKSGHDTIVLIGPEGDFSKEEITIARKRNWEEVSLGNSRLRTETAGIVATHLLNIV